MAGREACLQLCCSWDGVCPWCLPQGVSRHPGDCSGAGQLQVAAAFPGHGHDFGKNFPFSGPLRASAAPPSVCLSFLPPPGQSKAHVGCHRSDRDCLHLSPLQVSVTYLGDLDTCSQCRQSPRPPRMACTKERPCHPLPGARGPGPGVRGPEHLRGGPPASPCGDCTWTKTRAPWGGLRPPPNALFTPPSPA